MSGASVLRVEARSYEIDAYGHLNQAVSLQWFEHGRLVYLRERGLTYDSIPEDHGVHIMVIHQDVTYHVQIRSGDEFDVTSRIARFGRSSFTWEHELLPVGGGEHATTGRVTMVCVGPDGKSTPLPEAVRTAMAEPPVA